MARSSACLQRPWSRWSSLGALLVAPTGVSEVGASRSGALPLGMSRVRCRVKRCRCRVELDALAGIMSGAALQGDAGGKATSRSGRGLVHVLMRSRLCGNALCKETNRRPLTGATPPGVIGDRKAWEDVEVRTILSPSAP
ncbi:hypothetical protein PHYSODRAFT_304267 [Phytophthora sojae]|uniref:Uncharacterized protein n=1 Tax=Phytophthora sojae (strain P6497) TaxID=1094619 RepID=G4ZYI1_PHYSP|nr:hypothetical protein PHYSODRAFT_304267 [Phytophthora sojae]EGZ12740.1 hypothetical protein PHYSODRAFT_304267 [Phytophthora sojae]|eukprot:XP_009533073.1 hypothetical protein PHYSODRAFT_304267 [Phytophthora sojae]